VAAELRKDLNVEATLVPGSGGIFEVKVDGKTVYAKSDTGRFPNLGEIAEKLNAGK
jgi:selenoprotein W-related protein